LLVRLEDPSSTRDGGDVKGAVPGVDLGLATLGRSEEGKWFYGFITTGPFVCEYARGHKDTATCQVELRPE
jgi:hypothetical protein